MPLPLIIAGAAVVAVGVYKRYRNDQQLVEQTKKPGDAYRLPPCCLQALQTTSSRGTLAASIGAFVSSASLIGTAQPTKPSARSVQQTAKAAHDGWGLVTMDWEKEAELHASFFVGVLTLSNVAMFNVVEQHRAQHARENDSDAFRFWTRLYERKRSRLHPSLRRAHEIADQIP